MKVKHIVEFLKDNKYRGITIRLTLSVVASLIIATSFILIITYVPWVPYFFVAAVELWLLYVALVILRNEFESFVAFTKVSNVSESTAQEPRGTDDVKQDGGN